MDSSNTLHPHQNDEFLVEIAYIFAKGVLRHIRIKNADSLQNGNHASKKEWLASSSHGSLYTELTVFEPGKEKEECQ